MSRRVKPYNFGDTAAGEQALEHLKAAREIYKRLKAPKALEKVRLAISSGKGVLRNLDYRWINQEKGGPR